MKLVRRVVFDSSTLVSVVLRSSSLPEKAFRLALQNCVVCVSDSTLDELRAVLARGKFDRYLGKAERLQFVSMLRGNAEIFHVSVADLDSVWPSCRDRGDNKFLALAAVSEADLIVSSDDDLLVLNPWNGIPIVTPADFLSQWEGS